MFKEMFTETVQNKELKKGKVFWFLHKGEKLKGKVIDKPKAKDLKVYSEVSGTSDQKEKLNFSNRMEVPIGTITEIW